jgi:hypothetical protein
MGLRYLDFEHSEDTEGVGVFEAMACVATVHVPTVLAEVTLVLDWAFAAFPGSHGPLEEGFEWDHDLQRQQEPVGSETRHTVTLSLSGRPAFCQAFLERFPPS